MRKAGAVGYVLKDEPLEGILEAVRAAARGRVYFSPDVAAKVAAWARGERPGGLTEREWEVLRWMAEGRSNREIALVLSISEHTVEKHVGRVLEKLGARSRAGVVRWAVERGCLRGQGNPVHKNGGFPVLTTGYPMGYHIQCAETTHS